VQGFLQFATQRDTSAQQGDAQSIAQLGNALPTVTAGATSQATLTTNSVGSFQILAYVDTNQNGSWDTGETGLTAPLILVQASLAPGSNLSAGQPGNITATNMGGIPGTPGILMETGNFIIAKGANQTAGMYLGATVNLVGGGQAGTRGTDRVLGGWVQNVLAVNNTAQYGGGHSIPMLLATNGAQRRDLAFRLPRCRFLSPITPDRSRQICRSSTPATRRRPETEAQART